MLEEGKAARKRAKEAGGEATSPTPGHLAGRLPGKPEKEAEREPLPVFQSLSPGCCSPCRSTGGDSGCKDLDAFSLMKGHRSP